MDPSKERLLTLLELLQVRRRMSGEEIAARLEVSPRTVRRYILGLQEMGIPVEAERGRAGGYRMRPGFKLPPLMFTNEEALSLVLGLLAVERLGLVGPGAGIQGALAKLDRVLPTSLRDRLRAAQETLHLGLGRRSPSGVQADAETVLTVSTAARDGVRLRITYRSARGEQTDRLIDPYGVAFHGGSWYVVAFDHLRSDLRTFRLDRLIGVEPTRESFQRPDGIDVREQLLRSLASVPYAWMAEVVLDASPEEARQRVAPSVGTLEPIDGGVRLRLGADDLGWIVRYLAGLGMNFTVISPPELRDAVLREAERLEACAAR
ncbi:MAG TPA: YafY family protein [Candidatus Binatia bacterium]|nr:YafY family protein [Candidatus Binatia bacterium]